jgi:hypothetical protein
MLGLYTTVVNVPPNLPTCRWLQSEFNRSERALSRFGRYWDFESFGDRTTAASAGVSRERSQ